MYLRVSIHKPPSAVDLVAFLPDPLDGLAEGMMGREVFLLDFGPGLRLDVRAEADVLVAHLVDRHTGLGPDHGVDPAHFVGAFPGALEHPPA